MHLDRRTLIPLGLAAVAAVVLLCLWLTAPNLGATPLPSPSPSLSPSPSVEPTPTVTPPSAALIAKTKHAYAKALTAHGRLRFADQCLGVKAPPRPPRPPRERTDETAWTSALDHYRLLQKQYATKLAHAMDHITSPGGPSCGIRWVPLLRYVGWKALFIPSAVGVMQNESSGIETNHSPTDDHGLFQFNYPSWWRTFRQQMGVAFFPGGMMHARQHKLGIYDPLLNARFAWWVFSKVQHFSWWPAWRGDHAATF